jgi:hypothetical protein
LFTNKPFSFKCTFRSTFNQKPLSPLASLLSSTLRVCPPSCSCQDQFPVEFKLDRPQLFSCHSETIPSLPYLFERRPSIHCICYLTLFVCSISLAFVRLPVSTIVTYLSLFRPPNNSSPFLFRSHPEAHSFQTSSPNLDQTHLHLLFHFLRHRFFISFH